MSAETRHGATGHALESEDDNTRPAREDDNALVAREGDSEDDNAPVAGDDASEDDNAPVASEDETTENSRRELGTLYVVATPIGNLQDITLRALEVLGSVDGILAEDTRRTRKLLSHFDLSTPMSSLHEHNEDERVAAVVERVAAGESLALVSDAGTPVVSDPGYPLVRAAVAAGIPVVPVPGASAVLASLVASGLPPDRFTFVGYLPRKPGARRRALEELRHDPGTLIFLESPRRLPAMLADAARVLGARRASVARELTKVHEEFLRGSLEELAASLAGTRVRGEVTVCVGGASGPSRRHAVEEAETGEVASDADLGEDYRRLLEEGLPRNDALRAVARAHRLSRNEVYRRVIVSDDDPGI